MTEIRRRVRAVTLAWLLCQVASLSAFVPELCCVSHAAEAAAKEGAQKKAEACHEAPAPVPEPKEGDACPMHQGTQSHDCCAISNACGGPGTHLLTLFSFVSTIDEPSVSTTTLASTPAFMSPAPPLLYSLGVPDAPPPKA